MLYTCKYWQFRVFLRDNTEDLTYNSAAQDLLLPFWTPYFITNSKTVDWFTKTDARPFKTCMYKVQFAWFSFVNSHRLMFIPCSNVVQNSSCFNTIDSLVITAVRWLGSGYLMEPWGTVESQCNTDFLKFLLVSDQTRKVTQLYNGAKITFQRTRPDSIQSDIF